MIEQLIIATFGVAAVWCSQASTDSVRRWASVLGLCAQPAWFYAAWKAQQHGILLLCLFYSASWARGFWWYWVRKDNN